MSGRKIMSMHLLFDHVTFGTILLQVYLYCHFCYIIYIHVYVHIYISISHVHDYNIYNDGNYECHHKSNSEQVPESIRPTAKVFFCEMSMLETPLPLFLYMYLYSFMCSLCVLCCYSAYAHSKVRHLVKVTTGFSDALRPLVAPSLHSRTLQPGALGVTKSCRYMYLSTASNYYIYIVPQFVTTCVNCRSNGTSGETSL